MKPLFHVALMHASETDASSETRKVEVKRQVSIRFLKRHSTGLELGSGQSIAYRSNLLDADEGGLRCSAKLQRQMDENDGVPHITRLCVQQFRPYPACRKETSSYSHPSDFYVVKIEGRSS